MLYCYRELIFQWGIAKYSSASYHTINYNITYNTLYSLLKSSAYRGQDGSGDERYINWQNNSQARIGHDVGGFNWFGIGI